jgi:hypothetical protein
MIKKGNKAPCAFCSERVVRRNSSAKRYNETIINAFTNKAKKNKKISLVKLKLKNLNACFCEISYRQLRISCY